ncbi:MAG TPA: hypothetical protein PKD85_04655 [Saprospiraceae bacterium]|nr:hypothetical protein [Saprospiraceae bacterium]
MDIHKINTKYKSEIDTYYRAEHGVSSSILSYNNQVMVIQAIITKPRNKSYNAIAVELAHLWKKSNKELNSSLACKVFIVDLFKSPFKIGMTHFSNNYDAKKGVIFYRQYLN